ncbi:MULTISPECIES: GNAT family N-acetyltransferase [Micromonospora]|jgi:RimJ/RimL family protein N-acetyltransferase|nr:MULTISPECIES: GNAT family protein [Micromonospora]
MLVRLRPVSEDDYGRLPTWTRHSAAGVLVGGGQSDGLDAAGWRSAIESGHTEYAAIETRIDGETIGMVSWRPLAHDRSFAVGAVVGDDQWWDSGAGLEGALLLVDHLFQRERAHRLELLAACYNRRSVAFLAKGDLVVDGVLRDYLYVDGGYHDAVICSMNREEYLAPLDGYLPSLRLICDADADAAAGTLRRYLAGSGGDHLRGVLSDWRMPEAAHA